MLLTSAVGDAQFVRRRSLTRRAVFDRSLPDELIDRLWRDPEAVVRSGQLLRRTGLRRTVCLQWGADRYVLKHYRPTWWHFVRQLPMRSAAMATFNATHRLIEAGIATPPAVACIENRWGRLQRDSFLMYRYVEGTMLRTLFSEPEAAPRLWIDNLSDQLRDMWRRLERLHASLADAHAGNFVVNSTGQVWVIDLDKTRFERWTAFAARHRWRKWKHLFREAKAFERMAVATRRLQSLRLLDTIDIALQTREKHRQSEERLRPAASPIGRS